MRNAEAESTATGRHFKVVRARVDASWGSSSLALFEPDNEGLSMAVELEADETLTLLVENESCQPIWLQKGQVLGKLEPICLVVSSKLLIQWKVILNPVSWLYLLEAAITFQFQRKRGSS